MTPIAPLPPPPVIGLTPARLTDWYRFDELLSDTERDVRDRVRAWADSAVIPVANDYWERAQFPFEPVPGYARLASPAANSRATAAPG